MNYDKWYKFLAEINKMSFHVVVIYSARGIKKKEGIIQGTSTRWIQIDDKRISYRNVIDVIDLAKENIMGKVKFTIECEMKERWVPHFLAMLLYMSKLGDWGMSREVGIMSDGDGDFRPKFTWDEKFDDQLLEVNPIRDIEGNRLYDAG